MTLHYDFKIMAAAKLTRLLNRVVQPSEMVIGVPRAPTFATSRNTMVDIAIGDETYKIAYDRLNLNARMLAASTAKTTIVVTALDYEAILTKINHQYGTNFAFDDFETVDVDRVASTIFLTFKDTNVSYLGTFNVNVFLNLGEAIELTNLWRLVENDVDEGTMEVPLGGEWAYPLIDGMGWGKLGNGRVPLSFPDGCELPLTGDYIYDFEMCIISAARYLCALASDPLGDGYVKSRGSLYFYNQQMYLYEITSQIGPVFDLNKPFRLTFYGTGGQLKIYADGVLITTIAQPSATWKCFRNSEAGATPLGENSYIRNFKVIRRAPTADEANRIINGTAIVPKYPVANVDVAFAPDDWSNRGTDASTLNTAIPSVMHYGKTYYGFNSTRGPVALGTQLAFTGDFSVDFEIATVATSGYNAIFKTIANNNTFSTGDFTTITQNHAERGKPYMYEVSQVPLSLRALEGSIPVRHTIVRKGGVVTWYEDGVLASIAQGPKVNYNFVWNYLNASRGQALFRNLRFWKFALTNSQLVALFANK